MSKPDDVAKEVIDRVAADKAAADQAATDKAAADKVADDKAASDKVVADLTTERDTLKTERDTIKTEVARLEKLTGNRFEYTYFAGDEQREASIARWHQWLADEKKAQSSPQPPAAHASEDRVGG